MNLSFIFNHQVENQLGTYCPDAFLVVLAVDDVTSLDQAERILAYLKIVGMLEPDCSPCILVANKTDLVRNRVVKSSGGISIMLIPFNGRVVQYKMSCYMNLALAKLWHRSTTLNI